MNDLADEDIYREVGKIVRRFDLYQCYDCAMTFRQWLRDNGIEGRIIELKTFYRDEDYQTEREVIFYEGFHEFVQNCYQVHSSKSWAKIIMLYCSDEKQEFDRFFELLEEFETSSEYFQKVGSNLVEA